VGRFVAGLLAAWLVALSVPHPGQADPGDLDPGFGQRGKVRTDFGGYRDQANALILQPDGKLVAAGFSGTVLRGISDFALARYHADGSLDPAFGTGGLVRTDFGGGFDQAIALVRQPDGKPVAAGFSEAGGISDFALARYQGN
jgi:uncharacterized delta-60 repeat protein